MRTSIEKHLVEQLQLVLALCGRVSGSYTMPNHGLWDDARDLTEPGRNLLARHG